jgi:single-stranded-DNA-specific exonuclease
LEEFSKRLSSVIAEELAGKELVPVLKAEMEVGLSNLNPVLIPLLESLDPCGEQNPTPLFISLNVEITAIRTLGISKDHIRLDVRSRKDEQNSQKITYSGIGFNLGWMAEQLEAGSVIDILYSFENNEFNGRKTPQLNIRDIKTAG